MTKVRDLLNDALLQIGILDPSEGMDAGQAQSALRTLNRMIQVWNADELMVYSVNRETFPLVPNQQSYTIGPGGNFNTQRPVVIDMVSVIQNTTGSNPVEIPIEIYNDEQWRDLTVKNTPSTFPLVMWATGDFPLNVLWFWPIPQQVNNIVLYAWNQVADFPNINATVQFPPGYEEAIVNNLALRLCPMYGVQPNPGVVALAQGSMARIKRINWEPSYRTVDAGLSGKANLDIWVKSRGYVLD